MLLEQEEDFLQEFIDVVKTKEQVTFAQKWFKERYVPLRSAAKDMWVSLAK